MSGQQSDTSQVFTKQAVDAAIKIAVIFLVVIWCFEIVKPFIMPIVWGGIIAIALSPLVLKLASKSGLSLGKSSALVTVLSLALLLVPTFLFSGALVTGTQDFIGEVQEGTFVIPSPKESVADLPLIGDKLYQFWDKSSTNLDSVVKAHAEEIKSVVSKGASALGGFGMTVLQFVISIIIAGVFITNGKGASEVFHKIAIRLAGSHGEEFSVLSVATVRSVVQGVIGVALIQSILSGIGMGLVGVPATGIWMLIVLLLAIVQLPPILILAPIMAYVFSVESSSVAIMFMVWGILVSASDAILKPMLMGRGVDIPMLVILIGAIGGMMLSGIVGLFVGAVVLALGYKLFIAWIDSEPDSVDEEEIQSEAK
ncbi:AI-2E family transporter [Shewanella sp. UCD-KL12]|uniref:AI-2E family transporter n=1 Tax=Shewanella sp. UCD-KL12 TaxID=1917163 RepID=UPI000970FF5E|nr:AI-2E family transporter [Shewanella sp. UCD-KL12]